MKIYRIYCKVQQLLQREYELGLVCSSYICRWLSSELGVAVENWSSMELTNAVKRVCEHNNNNITG